MHYIGNLFVNWNNFVRINKQMESSIEDESSLLWNVGLAEDEIISRMENDVPSLCDVYTYTRSHRACTHELMHFHLISLSWRWEFSLIKVTASFICW